MSHSALQRLARTGLKSSHRLSVLPIKHHYFLRCNQSISPVSSNVRDYHRSFMNKIEPPKASIKSPDEILTECSRLYESLSDLNENLGGTAIPKSSPHTRWVQTPVFLQILILRWRWLEVLYSSDVVFVQSLPFCLLVGNHSSGKSSFINYIMKRDIQKAGVAPTDDNFTIITPGPVDTDADGPTLVGDPDLGFTGLRQFGPTLIHHSQLKYRKSDLNFMLVDSP